MNLLARSLERRFKIDATYFLHGGFWLVTAQAMTIIASLLSTVFLTHYLTEHDFGVYRYVISVGLFLTSLSLTGIAQSVFQAALKNIQGFYGAATAVTLRYSLGIVAGGLLASGYYFYQSNITLAIGSLLVAVFTPWSLLFQNAHGQLLGARNFRLATNLLTVKSFFVAGLTTSALFFTTNILILLTVYFTSQAIAGLAAHLLYRPRSSRVTDRAETQKLISFAKHSSLRNVIVGISSRLDNLIVFQQLGGASLAVFTIATLLPDQIKGSLKHIVTLLIPKFSQYGTASEVRKYLPIRSLQAGVLLVGVSIITIVCAPIIIETLFPKYVAAIPYTQLLALSFPASIYQIPFAIMQAHTAEKALYNYHIYTAVFQILFTVVGIMLFGLLGAILARIVTQYAQLLVAWYSIYRHA